METFYHEHFHSCSLRPHVHVTIFICISNILVVFAPSIYSIMQVMIWTMDVFNDSCKRFENAAVLQSCKQTKMERIENDSFEDRKMTAPVGKGRNWTTSLVLKLPCT